MIFTWASASNNGLVRSHNEDSVAPRDMGIEMGSLVVGVADGMGGAVGGEVASSVALQAALGAAGSAADRVRAANRAVVEAADEDHTLRGMGTTLTLAVFSGDSVEVGHVGDSRAYLLRGGRLTQITTDHSLVAELVSRGEISPDEADHHPYRSVITRALGLQDDVKIDEQALDLDSGDVVLVCSDGLSGMVPADQMSDLLLAEDHPTQVVWSLVDAANTAGGVDNISVVVVRVDDEATA